MKRVIDKQELARLEQICARGKRLTNELTRLENQARTLLRIAPGDETSIDLVVECVWSATPVPQTLKLLGVRVRE